MGVQSNVDIVISLKKIWMRRKVTTLNAFFINAVISKKIFYSSDSARVFERVTLQD